MMSRAEFIAAAEWLAEAPTASGGLPLRAGLADLARHAHAVWSALPPPAATPRCAKGCSGCCHQRACVTPAEAMILAPLMRTAAIRRRLRALRRRRAYEVDPWRGWLQAGIACPLLDEAGACSVHPARALVCREHLVTSDPGLCRDPSGTGVELMPLPIRLGDALALACARLRRQAIERIPIDAVPSWVRLHRGLQAKRWPRDTVRSVFAGALSEVG